MSLKKADSRDYLKNYVNKTVVLEGTFIRVDQINDNFYGYFVNIKKDKVDVSHHLKIPIKKIMISDLKVGDVYFINGIVKSYDRKIIVDGIEVFRKDYCLDKVNSIKLSRKSILISGKDLEFFNKSICKEVLLKILDYLKVFTNKSATLLDFYYFVNDIVIKIK